jgi:two-component system nitrogen regulation response regulator GlnG
VAKLLVIDDELPIQHAFRRAFQDQAVDVLTAETAAAGIDVIRQKHPDAVVLDLNLPDRSGLDAYRSIQEIDARIPVIFITGHGTTDTAIEAVKRGAYDFLFKPLELLQLREVVKSALEVSRRMNVPVVTLAEESPNDLVDVLIGRCQQMQKVYRAIGRVAPQDVTVLIEGESGTGKELVARAIYQHSKRAHAPFLALNCAAIPENLLESELFGHEKGAFTGAERKRIGKFEQCHGGTLFLDEIGDMPPLTQTKILRLLQEQRFERVGGNEMIETDVRVIAATNRNLELIVRNGEFRSDLYYRIAGYTIQLPPLRERLDDMPLLVNHFVRRYSREFDKNIQKIADDTLAILKQYSWPGNVRELESVLRKAILEATGPVLLPAFLPPLPSHERPKASETESPYWESFVQQRLQAGSNNLYGEARDLMERELLSRVLEHTNGNQLQAAKILGITRGSLRHKLRALNVAIEMTIARQETLDNNHSDRPD